MSRNVLPVRPNFAVHHPYLWILLLFVEISTSLVGAVGHDSMGSRERMKPPSERQWPLHGGSPTQASILHDYETHLALLDIPDAVINRSAPYSALLNALHVLEAHYFSVSHGTWPDAIDWTAAVMGTHVSASLTTMSDYSSLAKLSASDDFNHENMINRYFTQLTSFYFGENAFSLRTQAYDDMLWVVLGWIESVKFINRHSRLHYTGNRSETDFQNVDLEWYARQFIPQFAHRARLFYDLAAKGWDITLCGGGMIWNPRLAPYKNAITNQLFIAASVSMYLYFPGDDNPSPFSHPVSTRAKSSPTRMPPAKAHDKHYLQAAIHAYNWLKDSKMRNTAGLYTDGFHIRGWRRHGSNGTEQCDLRDETVYTYNQGVILSALRGLWEATGKISYLQDGHDLINDVIFATGWANRNTERRYQWQGLGREGIMEEMCDWSGLCSQDSQTFKGIFWHHFTIFCSLLPTASMSDDSDDCNEEEWEAGLERPWLRDKKTRALHEQRCDGYGPWITANARAAWVTRDEAGEFGEWWGRPWPGTERSTDGDNDHMYVEKDAEAELEAPSTIEGSIDYRNKGVPNDEVWCLDATECPNVPKKLDHDPAITRDLNDRGRGRTVETQSGGVAIMRALWKLVDSRREENS